MLVVFLDQQATRAESGQPQQLAAAGRPAHVTGQLVDGTWKIAEVQARKAARTHSRISSYAGCRRRPGV